MQELIREINYLKRRLEQLESLPSVVKFSQLTDGPGSLTGQALKLLQVNAAETDLEFLTSISDTQHGSRGGGSLHSAATTGSAGFMSAADKTKIDQFVPAASKTLTVSNTMTLASSSDGDSIVFDVAARVYNNADLTILDNTNTILTFNSERFDTDGMHSTVSNTSRLTVTRAGKYLIIGLVRWTLTTGGRRVVSIKQNGATYIGRSEIGSAADATAEPGQIVSAIYDLALTDYVELEVFQNRGGSLNVRSVGNTSPEFMMFRVA